LKRSSLTVVWLMVRFQVTVADVLSGSNVRSEPGRLREPGSAATPLKRVT
jgi:hypothetical protein